MGFRDGCTLGLSVGVREGALVGSELGCIVMVGLWLGPDEVVGKKDGYIDPEGLMLGCIVGMALGSFVGEVDGCVDGFVEGAMVGSELGDIVWICIEFAISSLQARPLRAPSPSTAKSKSYTTPATVAMFKRKDSVKVSLAPGARSLASPPGSASYIPENGLITVAFSRLASNIPVFVAVYVMSTFAKTC